MSKETPEKQQKKELKKYKKIILVLVLFLLVISLLSYGTLLLLSYGKSLPGTNLMGNDVGLKDKSQINAYIKKISDANLQRVVTVKIDDQSVDKKVGEFAVEVDGERTSQIALDYGKSYETFPNWTYFKSLLSGSTDIDPIFSWTGDSEKLLESLPNNEKAPENAGFEVKDGEISIRPEKIGYKLDLASFMQSIEKCLAKGCPGGIIAKTQPSQAEITAAKLSAYLPTLSQAASNGLVLNASEKYKKYTVDTNNLVSFVDLKKTLEQQSLWWNETNIETYLKDTISPKININGKPKQISSYDNSVLSEGREGYGLQLEPSKIAVKKALIDGQKIVNLSIGTTPIEEEYVGPGFTANRVEGKYIDVNLSEQMLYTLEGSKLVGSYRVSTGKWSLPTPIGEFAINNKDERAYSAQYDLYMPYWMAFIGHGYGIHELPETSSGRKEGESSLGVPVSHGCIRLGVGDAKTIYDWAEVGTPVFTHT